MRSTTGPDMEAQEHGQEGEETRVQVKRPLDLSRTDLLQLLGIMEGEVQAREDVIGLMKSQRAGPALLEAQYGSAVPSPPLQALQRDGEFTCRRTREDVYQKPLMKLERLQDTQKETYRRMLEQLLLAEKFHRRTVVELNSEKRKHIDFMNKSDDFTDLLEQERERLKILLEQEKTFQARKDKDNSRRLDKLREELVKLQSFALMLVDETQLHLEQMDQQTQKVQELTQKLQDRETRLMAAEGDAREERRKVSELEAELEQKSSQLAREHAEMNAKLAEQETSKHLRLRICALTKKTEELEELNKVLTKSEEDLRELKNKRGSPSAELESLRRKVLEMEGKDEEMSKIETQCRELRTKLQDEENISAELRLEVDQLHKRMVEMEKLESAFHRSKTECHQVMTHLEREKDAVKRLTGELDQVKARAKELESVEKKFETSELLLKDDLMRLKSLTVILVDERKNLVDKLRLEEEKSRESGENFKVEQNKVTEITEKLIEESKKLLKLKSETDSKVTTLCREKEELKMDLAGQEDKCSEMSENVSRLEEEVEEMERRNDEDKRELSREVDRLRSRLEQLEVLEGDLLKTEDEYVLLQQRFRSEQDRANVLSNLLEETRSQMVKNKKLEKVDAVKVEAELRTRCRTEEARSRELQADVQALKEKIHELMNTEDQLSQLQVDFSVLQQKCLKEEVTSRGLSHEVDHLTQELEASRRYSRMVRPGTNGRRMVNVPVTSTATQTDPVADDDSTAGFIRKSVQEENLFMNNLRHGDLGRVLDPAAPQCWTPWLRRPQVSATPGLVRGPGRPLHIRVRPDQRSSTATLEITSPKGKDFFSSTTIIPTLGQQTPHITIVPKPCKTLDPPGRLRVDSPVTITTICRAKSPEQKNLESGVSIITVSTAPVSEGGEPPEPRHPPAGRTVIRMTPERRTLPGSTYSNSSIFMSEDNKIHIQLGPQVKKTCDPSLKTTPGKMKSSIMITPLTSGAPRPAPGPVPPRTRLSRSLTPVSGTKVLDVSTRVQASSEGRSVKIELKKSTAVGSRRES